MSQLPNANSDLTKRAADDYFSKEIKNLEMLDYYAQKMDQIYYYKDYVLFFPTLEKQLTNIERWKTFKIFCIFVIIARLLFTKPDWCSKNSTKVTYDCSRDIDGNILYNTVVSDFLDFYNFEILSWFVMLILILIDLFNLEVKAGYVFTYCALFIFDIISGFFYMHDFIDYKINHLSTFFFLIIYM